MKELIKRLLDARRDGLNIAGEIYTENGTINIRHCFSLINTTLSDESIEIKDGDFEFYLDQKCVKDCQYYSSQDCYNIVTDTINLSLTFV